MSTKVEWKTKKYKTMSIYYNYVKFILINAKTIFAYHNKIIMSQKKNTFLSNNHVKTVCFLLKKALLIGLGMIGLDIIGLEMIGLEVIGLEMIG